MSIFTGKHILLAVTGSIAAYKAVDLASKLTQSGAQVDVLMTSAAEKFISPLSFQSVTGRKVYTDEDLWGGQAHVLHVGLGHSADLLLIAPATANTLAKLAHGIADNLVSITALAARCPSIIAPAMDAGMYEHPVTQENVRILQSRGIVFAGPSVGRMASGLEGPGRFLEPAALMGHIRLVLGRHGPLAGKKIVITAGGTQEPIDPVRVIANRSSGKQGYALTQAALDAGASVTLISSTVTQVPPIGASVIHVQTAQEMLEAVLDECSGVAALIMAAAVADFRAKKISPEKIKKDDGLPEIEFEATPDILKTIAGMKSGKPQVVVGFAAESTNLLDNATDKLKSKQLDFIAANDISASDSGFGVDTNRITLLFADGRIEALSLMSKEEASRIIIERLTQILEQQ